MAQRQLDLLSDGCSDATPLTPGEVAYFRMCLREMGGEDIMEAILFYKNARKAVDNPITVQEAYEKYIKALQGRYQTVSERDVIERHVDTVKNRLRPLTTNFKVRLRDVTAEDLRKVLHGKDWSPRTKNNSRAAISSFFHWAIRHELVATNPVKLIDKIKETPSDPEIFTPEEMAAMLKACPNEWKPFFTLGGFAGIRASEIGRLVWEDILWDQHTILLKSHITKKHQRRAVPLPPNLMAWLAPYRNWTGKIVPIRNPNRETAKVAKAAGVEWKDNGLRHSAISYLMAKLGNAATVAEQSGNSEEEVQRSYKAAVTPSESEKWFAIFPK